MLEMKGQKVTLRIIIIINTVQTFLIKLNFSKNIIVIYQLQKKLITLFINKLYYYNFSNDFFIKNLI